MRTKYWQDCRWVRKFCSRPFNPIMNIAIVYEDLEMGKRASRLCHSATHRLGAGHEVKQELWNFQLLDVAEIHTQAILATARADLIVVATRGYEELPLEVLTWIEGWVDRRHTHSGALVALFDELDPPGGARAGIESYLHYVARRGGLDFLTPVCPKGEAQPERASGSLAAEYPG